MRVITIESVVVNDSVWAPSRKKVFFFPFTEHNVNTLPQCHRPLGKGWLDEEEYDGCLRNKMKSFGCKVIVDLWLIRQRRCGLCRVPIPLWHPPVVRESCASVKRQEVRRMEGILEAVKMQLQLLRSKADDFQDRLLHRQELQPVKSLSWRFLPFLTLFTPPPPTPPPVKPTGRERLLRPKCQRSCMLANLSSISWKMLPGEWTTSSTMSLLRLIQGYVVPFYELKT